MNLNTNYYRTTEILRRHPSNPILTAGNWPYQANSIFNPGAILLKDDTTLLLCRVEDLRGHSHLCAARSFNGIDHWEIDATPTFSAEPDHYPSELWGVEDPRITYLAELDQYAVTYTAYGSAGPSVSLALTRDFHVFERYGTIMLPENKDAALLPRRINGLWALLHRPVGQGNRQIYANHSDSRKNRRSDDTTNAHIWMSFSRDLHTWENHTKILEARLGSWWDANKIGLSSPVIETSAGWLMIYHGVKQNAAGCIYRLGLALFDLNDPTRCLKRSNEWMFGPREDYELHGDVDKVVFPCGHTIASDRDTLRLYYGAADTSIAIAEGSIKGMLEWLMAQ